KPGLGHRKGSKGLLITTQNLACRLRKWLDGLTFCKWNCDHVYVSLLESRNCFRTKGRRSCCKYGSTFMSCNVQTCLSEHCPNVKQPVACF
ncbi:hypothetical protein QQP08_000513, partial [Theobroma cacao]